MCLEEELSKMGSFEAIKYVLDGIELHDLQCIDVMKMLASKRAVVSYTTGLGKTVLAAAVMKLLWNENPGRKFVFLGKNDQLTQTPDKLRAMCGRKVIASHAAAKSISSLFSNEYKNYSVLFLTHTALLKPQIMNDLFKHRGDYCGLFIDEAHELNNAGFAEAASVLAGMTRQFEYCYALTATPITTAVEQMAKLANIVDYKRFPDVQKLKRGLLNGSTKIDNDPCFFINRTRDEFGSRAQYEGIVEFVDPLPHQLIPCGAPKLFELCKGDGAFPQAKALVRLIKERAGQRGLVYINQHSVREWVIPFLEEAGIRFECINGYTNMAERSRIMDEFNVKRSIDVVLTSVTTAIDLDCDFVIFYEFTVEVKQMIGRAHRGLGDKKLDVIFVLTNDTSEIDYFYNNIYSISMTIKSILSQDFTELEQIDSELKQNAEN